MPDTITVILSREQAKWLTDFLAVPGLHTDQEDEENRRAIFHTVNNKLAQ